MQFILQQCIFIFLVFAQEGHGFQNLSKTHIYLRHIASSRLVQQDMVRYGSGCSYTLLAKKASTSNCTLVSSASQHIPPMSLPISQFYLLYMQPIPIPIIHMLQFHSSTLLTTPVLYTGLPPYYIMHNLFFCYYLLRLLYISTKTISILWSSFNVIACNPCQSFLYE